MRKRISPTIPCASHHCTTCSWPPGVVLFSPMISRRLGLHFLSLRRKRVQWLLAWISNLSQVNIFALSVAYPSINSATSPLSLGTERVEYKYLHFNTHQYRYQVLNTDTKWNYFYFFCYLNIPVSVSVHPKLSWCHFDVSLQQNKHKS